jgi:hypothetical protein
MSDPIADSLPQELAPPSAGRVLRSMVPSLVISGVRDRRSRSEASASVATLGATAVDEDPCYRAPRARPLSWTSEARIRSP